MNFQCKELIISDDELGCTLTFSESMDEDLELISIDDIMNSKERYLLIQRTYPEDKFEDDYYYIESSESDTELGYDDKITVRLSRESFEINWSGDRLKIGLDLTDKALEELRDILKIVFKERVIMKT